MRLSSRILRVRVTMIVVYLSVRNPSLMQISHEGTLHYVCWLFSNRKDNGVVSFLRTPYGFKVGEIYNFIGD